MWRSTDDTWGWAAVLLHWVTAVAVFGMFVLGLWMVELTYYDPWYHRAPWVHKGVGILLFSIVVLRLGWRIADPAPRPSAGHSVLDRRAASLAHTALYLLLFAVMLSGYLISTAEGQGLDVFGLFQVPATLSGMPGQADAAGRVHLVLAWALVGLAVGHGAAALKHHFVDRDRTLRRMLGRR